MSQESRTWQIGIATLVLRLGLAAVLLAAGYLGTSGQAPSVVELSPTVNSAIAWVEIGCGAALLLGLATRFVALAAAIFHLVGVLWLAGRPALVGLPLRWEVIEPALLALGVSLCILGGGLLSLDHLIWAWRRARREKDVWKAFPPPVPAGQAPGQAPGQPGVPSLNDRYRLACAALSQWADREENMQLVLAGDTEKICSQPEVLEILRPFQNYPVDIMKRLMETLDSMVQNRATYYRALAQRKA